MKFDLKLFVLVVVFVGLRDVLGMEEKEKDDDGFIVAGLKNKEEANALKNAMNDKKVIKAVYETGLYGTWKIIHSKFNEKLSYILVWDGKEVVEKDISGFKNDDFGNICYDMQPNKEYTVYFIFKDGGVDSTSYMFLGCSYLISADFRYFKTLEPVTNMSHMFYGCSSLTTLNLSNFNTKEVIDMSNMFYNCFSLSELNLSSFNTQNVTDMSGMFAGCKALSKINLENFNTEKVTNMSYMFYKCSSLTEVNLSSFDTKNVTNMSSMFKGCISLNPVFLPSKDAKIKKRCMCCGDYVSWNNREVGGLNPKKVQFKDPKEIIEKISTVK